MASTFCFVMSPSTTSMRLAFMRSMLDAGKIASISVRNQMCGIQESCRMLHKAPNHSTRTANFEKLRAREAVHRDAGYGRSFDAGDLDRRVRADPNSPTASHDSRRA